MTSVALAVPIVKEVYIEAPPEVVFEFLIDPKKVALWLGPVAELKPYRGRMIRVHRNKHDLINGRYLEVVPHLRITFVWSWKGSRGIPSPATNRLIYYPAGLLSNSEEDEMSPSESPSKSLGKTQTDQIADPKRVYPGQRLKGKIALVAGATRGAGRGIAIALGEAGAIVYCTGRSSRKQPPGRRATPGRLETIEETAELVTAAGGRGIAVRVDHTKPADVKKLVAAIKRRHKGLDILVNDVWGGDALTEFGKTFWTVNLENGLQMLKQAIHSHVITSHYAAPLMLRRARGKGRPIIFEITDGDAFYYRGNLFYDLVKISVIRLAFAMARELRKRDVVSVALTPGFLRSERVLEHFGVSEANWKQAGKRKDAHLNSKNQNDAPADFLVSESPRYIGRAVVALAADPNVKKKSGRVFSSWGLAREYGFTDLDGTRPNWGNHARRKYGKYKICDERFYSYWVPGLIELIFPDWF
jgi:NAD(P)-dependent dehydrogenase (short-subunit alcohol dehydrogenase family)